MPLIINEAIKPGVKLMGWRLDETTQELRERICLDLNGQVCLDSFKNEQRKKQWLGYRLLLQQLSEQDSVQVAYDENGKPFLPGSDFHVSVSHSGEYSVAIIDHNHPVGIDIEKIRDKIEKIKDRFLSAPELENIKNDNRLEMLHVCWGAKESLYKAYGQPDVDFKADIYLTHFDYLCKPTGQFPAQIRRGESLLDFMVNYRKVEDYMLVWTIKDEK
jgi:phosphopantetheinyl transferase (holo-ACP synthase)